MKKATYECTPLAWNSVGFDVKESVEIDGDVFNVYRRGTEGVVVYLLHGAGQSGLSFASLTEILYGMFKCQVIAPDLRGHGDTKCANPLALSKDQMVKDVIGIYKKLFPEKNPYTFVVGHSMGGAVAIKLCHENLIPNVLALVVIDVVEGTALAALADMPSVLRNRPKRFPTLEDAIRWASTGTDAYCRLPGARASIPSQFRFNEENSQYEWTLPLEKTSQFWVGWFTGISKEFLESTQGKILIIGHIDRLDNELTKAEIQGKFQNIVVPDAGHAIHENEPDTVAKAIYSYYHRFHVLIEKGVKIHL